MFVNLEHLGFDDTTDIDHRSSILPFTLPVSAAEAGDAKIRRAHVARTKECTKTPHTSWFIGRRIYFSSSFYLSGSFISYIIPRAAPNRQKHLLFYNTDQNNFRQRLRLLDSFQLFSGPFYFPGYFCKT